MGTNLRTWTNPTLSIEERLFSAVEERLEALTITVPPGADFYALEGAELPVREWLAKVEPGFDFDTLAEGHEELLQWIEELEADPKPEPPAFLADWPRGYGKTTWLRLFLYRMCVTKHRRFALVTSALQASANRTVQKLREYFDSAGIKRKESIYGFSVSWNAEVLITECGFIVVAVGLDTANTRGINILGLRPDIIAPDDMHKFGQSPELTQKNAETFTNTILGTGTDNTAVLFVQNSIESNSLMAGLLSHDVDALRHRRTSIHVAVEGLEIGSKPNPREGEPDLWTIEDGVSTWPGRALSYWESWLNRVGKLAFLREMQRQLGAGGLFFNFYPQRQSIDKATGELSPLLDWHVCDMPRIESWWLVDAGGDYGTRAAHAQVIGARDEYGVDYIIGEEYAEDRTAKQQAAALLLRLEELGLTHQPVSGVVAVRDKAVPGGIRILDRDGYEQPIRTRLGMFALDPAGTFAPQGRGATTAQERMTEYPEEVFYRYGIPLVRANKGKVAGLNNLREGLTRTVTYSQSHPTEPGRQVPMLRIVRGQAPLFQRYLETAVIDPKDELRAVASAKLQHIGDAGEYFKSRNIEARDPNAHQPIKLRDGTVLPENVSDFWRQALIGYAVDDSVGSGLSDYRGVAGQGR